MRIINTIKSLWRLYNIVEEKSPEFKKLLLAKSDDDYQLIMDNLLNDAADHLERNKKDFNSHNETALTGHVAAWITTVDLIKATQEANSNGHTDLTIEINNGSRVKKKMIGEAKIYNGMMYHINGVGQVLGYSTGRELSLFMLNYVKTEAVKVATKKIKDSMNKDLPHNQISSCVDKVIPKWSFLSEHQHKSSGEILKVHHYSINLH